MDMHFSTPETKSAFIDILTDLVHENPTDPLAYVRDFADMGEPVDLLARRLLKDAWACFGGMPGWSPHRQSKEIYLLIDLARSGLRRVDFREIASKLLNLARP